MCITLHNMLIQHRAVDGQFFAKYVLVNMSLQRLRVTSDYGEIHVMLKQGLDNRCPPREKTSLF